MFQGPYYLHVASHFVFMDSFKHMQHILVCTANIDKYAMYAA
jgi:hypothetical protein